VTAIDYDRYDYQKCFIDDKQVFGLQPPTLILNDPGKIYFFNAIISYSRVRDGNKCQDAVFNLFVIKFCMNCSIGK